MNQRRLVQAGFTLLPVMLAMSLVAAAAFLLNRDNGMNARMLSDQAAMDRARYAAEAGLQAANATIQGLGCGGGFPTGANPVANGNLSGASYSAYSTTSSGNSVTLVSTGTYNGTQVTLTRNNAIVYQAPAKTYTLQPDGTGGIDTYLVKNSTTNYGNANTLNLNASSNFPLIRFDLSMFPAGSLPVSAALSLYAGSGLGIGSATVQRMVANWTEGTGAASPVDGANWTTSNGSLAWTTPGGDYFATAVSSAGAITGSWMNFDVTDLAAAWLAGRYPNFGVLLKMTSGLGSLNFTSSDNSDGAHRPKLVFSYLVPCGTTGPYDPVGGTATLSAVADSFDDSGAVQTNNGSASSLSLYATAARENRILMRFDTASIPTGAIVSSAVLRLYVNNVTSSTTNTKAIWASPVSDAWVEGAGSNTSKSCPTTATAGASWNFSTGCTGWSYVHPPNAAPSWGAMAPMPTARTNLMVASVGGKLYAIGGRLFSSTYLNKVEAYDPASNTWTTMAPMPTARSDAGVTVVNGLIYVMGGDTGGSSATNKNEVYDPSTNTWTTKAPMTTGRRYLAAAAVNGKIYTLGGAKSTSAVKNNEMYDPSSNTWTTKTQMPTARMYFSAQAANSKIYAIGGWSGSASLKANEQFDPSANTWTIKSALPVAIDSMASAALGNKIYLIAGMRGNLLKNEVWRYDALADAYMAETNYPFSDDAPAAAAIGGYLFSLGGDDASATVFASHYRYDPGFPVPVATASAESTGISPLNAGFANGWIDFELKPLVQEWVDGIRPSNGLVIYTEVADRFSINGREAASNTPQLVVTYTH